jgi:predicted amidohydrolase YtcJ
MKKYALIFTTILLLISMFACGTDKPSADLIIINGTVATLDTANTIAEAIAIKDGKILFVGTNSEVNSYKGDSTKVIDAGGNFVMPGFIDSHAHFLGLGKSKQILDLKGTNNFDEVVAAVAEAAENTLPGEWITGRGWHQEKWDPIPKENVNGYPYHDQLSAASPLNPVYLTHASGHAIIANAKAMELAGVTSKTPNPSGGNIVKDSTGRLTGVFEENAEELITKVYQDYRSKLTNEQLIQAKIDAYLLAAKECLSKGITTLYDAGSTFEEIDLLKNLVDSNKISVRLNLMISAGNEELKDKAKDYRLIDYGDNHLTVRAVKKYIDGALGSRGAWLLSPR